MLQAAIGARRIVAVVVHRSSTSSIDSQASYRRFVPSTRTFDTPPLGASRQTIAMAFDAEKLEWFGYPMLKIYSSILYRFQLFTLNNIVTLKSGLDVTQGHSNWYHSKA